MTSQNDYVGPARLCFADGLDAKVETFLTMLRSYCGDLGEGHFVTSHDIADRALRTPARLTLELGDGRRGSIFVRESLMEKNGAVCMFSML